MRDFSATVNPHMLYMAAPVKLTALGGNLVLCEVHSSSSAYVIDRPLAQCLHYAQKPTAGTVIIEYMIRMAPCQREETFKWLSEAIENKMLLPAEPDRHVVPAVSGSAMSNIVCVSADRPRSMSSLYQSCLRYCETFGKQIQLTIINDSATRRIMSRYEELIRGWPNTCSVTVKYGDRLQRAMFCDHLARKGIPPELARFCILGVERPSLLTTGSGRNAALLEHHGSRLLFVDDDVLLETSMDARVDGEIAVCSDYSFRQPKFFPSLEAALTRYPATFACDLLAEHQQYLGASIASCISDKRINYPSALSPRLRAALFGGINRRLLISQSGVVGASGMATGAFWILNSGPWSSELMHNSRVLQLARMNRFLRSSPSCATITDNPFCQTMALGIADDLRLPCFLPIGRNEDGVFGSLAQWSQPGCIVHLPFAQCHSGSEEKMRKVVPPFRMAELILALAASCISARQRVDGIDLANMGALLELVLRGTRTEFRHLLNDLRTSRVASTITQITKALEENKDRSAAWELEMRRLMADARSSLSAWEAQIPLEMRHSDIDKSIEETLASARLTAKLWQKWSDIKTAAAELRATGITMTQPT